MGRGEALTKVALPRSCQSYVPQERILQADEGPAIFFPHPSLTCKSKGHHTNFLPVESIDAGWELPILTVSPAPTSISLEDLSREFFRGSPPNFIETLARGTVRVDVCNGALDA